ncbi:MAG: hypothetical protein ICV83_05045 [Cytophagales bacterium]|nr:hypothetical protein [Cytophagales bacterium]
MSQALQQRVSGIMNKPFNQITDDDLLAKLQEQVAAIKEESTAMDEDTIVDSLDTVDSLIDQIDQDIANGAFTPDATVSDAFDAYKAAQAAVDNAVNDPAQTAALDNLQVAHNNLVDAFEQAEAQQMSTYQQNLDDANQAIETARQASQRMDAISDEYEGAEQAESIQEYEDSMKSYDTSSAAEEAV